MKYYYKLPTQLSKKEAAPLEKEIKKRLARGERVTVSHLVRYLIATGDLSKCPRLW